MQPLLNPTPQDSFVELTKMERLELEVLDLKIARLQPAIEEAQSYRREGEALIASIFDRWGVKQDSGKFNLDLKAGKIERVAEAQLTDQPKPELVKKKRR